MHPFSIRKPTQQDATNLMHFVTQLDKESDYLQFGENERKVSLENTQKYLEKIENSALSVVYIAENEARTIIGFICGEETSPPRYSHTLKLNIGILKQYRGTIIARSLGSYFEAHCKENGIKRVEATIIKENKASLNLSKKFGMEIEGLKRAAVKINGNYHDEYMIAKLF